MERGELCRPPMLRVGAGAALWCRAIERYDQRSAKEVSDLVELSLICNGGEGDVELVSKNF
jgi:hypothetical protein